MPNNKMNTNLLNQAQQITEKFIKSIPTTEFYSTILTRPKLANIYDKYFNTEQYQLTQEQALRAIMVTAYRYINMSIQDVTVLLVYGLDNLSRTDLDLTERHLAEKLAQQNPDNNDIDVINRIIAQVVTKLPADLRDRLTPILRIRMIQKLNEDLQHMYDFMAAKRIQEQKQTPSPSSVAEPANISFFKEGFSASGATTNRLQSANVPATTSLNNNFLKEKEDIINSLGEKTVRELEANGYSLNNIAKSSIDVRFGAGDYEAQLKSIDSLPRDNKVTNDIIPENVIKSTYFQKDPQLQMDAKTKELYYFDEYSGTLTPISDVQKIKGEDITTEKQLNTLLKKYNLSKKEVDTILNDLKNEAPVTKKEHNMYDEVIKNNKHNTNYMMYGIGMVFFIILIVVIMMFLRSKSGKK